jgi:hypothetical protein
MSSQLEENAAIADLAVTLGWQSVIYGHEYVSGFPPGERPHLEDDRHLIPGDPMKLAELSRGYWERERAQLANLLALHHEAGNAARIGRLIPGDVCPICREGEE